MILRKKSRRKRRKYIGDLSPKREIRLLKLAVGSVCFGVTVCVVTFLHDSYVLDVILATIGQIVVLIYCIILHILSSLHIISSAPYTASQAQITTAGGVGLSSLSGIAGSVMSKKVQSVFWTIIGGI